MVSEFEISKSLTTYGLDGKEEEIGNALKEIKANTLVIGIKNDLLFPIVEQKLLANSISNAQYFEIN